MGSSMVIDQLHVVKEERAVHAQYFHVYNWRSIQDDYERLLRKTGAATRRYSAEPKEQPELTPVRLDGSYTELDCVNSETAFTDHLLTMDGEAPFNSLEHRLENQAAYKLEVLYAYRVPGKRMTKAFINYCLKESGYVLG